MRFLIKYKNFDPNYLSIICLFVIWKVILFITGIAAFELIPLFSQNQLGGGLNNYLTHYYLFPWANFDGEHLTSIAYFGYQNLQQAFFPLYPKLISAATYFLKPNLETITLTGYLISTISFLVSLIYLYKLLILDYSKRFALGVIALLLLYPASFYFNAVYSESLFLMLLITSFYNFRKKHYFLAGLIGFFAALSRVFGILLFLSFLIEIVQYKESLRKTFWIVLIPIGLLSYMTYLYISIGDPLAFYNLQLIVGEQHQRGIILYPQVIYRYLKIIFSAELTPMLTTILFELATGILFILLPIIGYYKKVRLSYLIFAFLGCILTTIQGSFSSLPRYVLILFPSFLILALLIKHLPNYLKITLAVLSFCLLIIETTLFLRGYWVA